MIEMSNHGKNFKRDYPVAGHSGPGFTLIELLVVMAILAALVGLMLPALAAARHTSLRSACASNLRQLAMANHAYASSQGTFVAAASDIWSSNLQRWHGTRAKTKASFDPALGPLAEYFDARGSVKQCPSFHSDEPGFEAGCGGYGYNAAGVGSQSYMLGTMLGAASGMAPEMIMNPDATVMFADTAFAETKKGVTKMLEYSFAEPYLLISDSRPVEAYPAMPSLHFRHDGWANVAWVDGHVSAEKISHSRSQTLEQNGLGWFGPADNSLFDPY